MKNILIYFSTFLIIVIIANYIYKYSGLYSQDIIKCNANLVSRIDSIKNTKSILYFAESSNFTYGKDEISHESISEILSDILKTNELSAINRPASHSGNYSKMINRLKGSKVKTIIVTMNLRSFGINWIESKLETNLSRENIFYSNYPPIFQKFLISFKGYDNKQTFERERIIKKHYKYDLLFNEKGKFKNVKDWDAFMFSKGHLNENGERDVSKCELSCHFIKNYAFIINENNPRVKDFDEIVLFCKTNNINLVINLLPENVEKAKNLCGSDLISLMEKNVKFLENRYSKESIFVNSLKLVSDSFFIDKMWPTEHYLYPGRIAVARNIAEKIKPVQ